MEGRKLLEKDGLNLQRFVGGSSGGGSLAICHQTKAAAAWWEG